MARHRARITRIVAALLTLALSAQIAEAHAGNCPASAAERAAITHEHHQANHEPGSGSHRSSHHDNAGTTGCSQSTICANAPAMTIDALRFIDARAVEQAVAFVNDCPTLRVPRPEPPPPKA